MRKLELERFDAGAKLLVAAAQSEADRMRHEHVTLDHLAVVVLSYCAVSRDADAERAIQASMREAYARIDAVPRIAGNCSLHPGLLSFLFALEKARHPDIVTELGVVRRLATGGFVPHGVAEDWQSFASASRRTSPRRERSYLPYVLHHFGRRARAVAGVEGTTADLAGELFDRIERYLIAERIRGLRVRAQRAELVVQREGVASSVVLTFVPRHEHVVLCVHAGENGLLEHFELDADTLSFFNGDEEIVTAFVKHVERTLYSEAMGDDPPSLLRGSRT